MGKAVFMGLGVGMWLLAACSHYTSTTEYLKERELQGTSLWQCLKLTDVGRYNPTIGDLSNYVEFQNTCGNEERHLYNATLILSIYETPPGQHFLSRMDVTLIREIEIGGIGTQIPSDMFIRVFDADGDQVGEDWDQGDRLTARDLYIPADGFVSLHFYRGRSTRNPNYEALDRILRPADTAPGKNIRFRYIIYDHYNTDDEEIISKDETFDVPFVHDEDKVFALEAFEETDEVSVSRFWYQERDRKTLSRGFCIMNAETSGTLPHYDEDDYCKENEIGRIHSPGWSP